MKQYTQQLLKDIDEAAANLSWPYPQKETLDLRGWLSPQEEDAKAPVRALPPWTGITPEMLPPQSMLNDDEIEKILDALKKLLAACNCHFILQMATPERLEYEAMRQNWRQEVKVREWHEGFFEVCTPGTATYTCALGKYCQCAFFKEFFKDMIDEDLAAEEERKRDLEVEIEHLKKKHGPNWTKYYPYHLDKNYDDEHGNPYNYGIEDDEEDQDDWWRK